MTVDSSLSLRFHYLINTGYICAPESHSRWHLWFIVIWFWGIVRCGVRMTAGARMPVLSSLEVARIRKANQHPRQRWLGLMPAVDLYGRGSKKENRGVPGAEWAGDSAGLGAPVRLRPRLHDPYLKEHMQIFLDGLITTP